MRLLAFLWPPACAAATATLWPTFRAEALVAGLAATALVALADRSFRRTLAAGSGDFYAAFGMVFCLKAAAFLSLCALAYWGGWHFLPLMGTYVSGVMGGTLAVALALTARQGNVHVR